MINNLDLSNATIEIKMNNYVKHYELLSKLKFYEIEFKFNDKFC